MGQIDKIIYQNYQKALKEGDMQQAQKSVELARYFKRLVEQAGFIDYTFPINENTPQSFQDPITYKYYPTTNYAYLNNAQIRLTAKEAELLELFMQYESTLDKILLINEQVIKNALWPNQDVTPQAIRVTVKRLKDKLEKNLSEEIIQNIYSKGYIFWAKRIY